MLNEVPEAPIKAVLDRAVAAEARGGRPSHSAPEAAIGLNPELVPVVDALDGADGAGSSARAACVIASSSTPDGRLAGIDRISTLTLILAFTLPPLLAMIVRRVRAREAFAAAQASAQPAA